MKKKTNKRAPKSSAKASARKASGKTAPAKLSAGKKKRTSGKASKRAVHFIHADNTVHTGFAKKASFKISSEFAISIIIVVVVFFGYVFWRGISETSFDSNENAFYSFVNRKNGAVKSDEKSAENWKLFRNASEGNEFSLPKDWKVADENNGSRFVSGNGTEEIVIYTEDNKKSYTPEKLLEDAKSDDKTANVVLLKTQQGVLIEKREGDVIKQTAKMIIGESIVSATYSAPGSENSGLFLEKIVPTFKFVEKSG